MKLLYVVHQYFPECFSGTEQYVLAVSREARRRGDEVTVLALDPDLGCDNPPLELREESYDGTPVLRLRYWWGLAPNEVLRDYDNPLLAAKFGSVLESLRPDAVHFFHLRNLGSDWIETARDHGVRTAVHLMDFWYVCPRFTLLRSDGTLCEGPPDGGLGCVPCHYPHLGAAVPEGHAALALQLAKARGQGRPSWHKPEQLAALVHRREIQLRRLALADAVFAPSRFLADMFARNGVPRERLQVEPYGLEPGRVQRVEVERPRTPLRLAFAGVLSPWKAPHLVVDAVRELAGDLRLQVHGRTEEPMFADYIAQMRERAASDARIAFPGPFDRDRISAVLADTDLLIVPSTWYENTPFVILEAFEAGVPVLASDLGGMSELIREGENGYLFEAGNAAALREVLRRCLADPSRLARLRPLPAGRISGNYDRFAAVYAGGGSHVVPDAAER